MRARRRAAEASQRRPARARRWAAPPSAPGSTPTPSSPSRRSPGIAEKTGIPFVEAENHFEAQAAKDGVVDVQRRPQDDRCQPDEDRQRHPLARLAAPLRHRRDQLPGSSRVSIMPGKVNPVMREAVIGRRPGDRQRRSPSPIGGQWGNFELNVMMPVMAYNLLQSIELLASAAEAFTERCVDGIEADRERCESFIEQSLAMCTPLAPVIGYDKAAADRQGGLPKRPDRPRGRPREERPPRDELDKVLDPEGMTRPEA